jgi:hypothetical protein
MNTIDIKKSNYSNKRISSSSIEFYFSGISGSQYSSCYKSFVTSIGFSNFYDFTYLIKVSDSEPISEECYNSFLLNIL